MTTQVFKIEARGFANNESKNISQKEQRASSVNKVKSSDEIVSKDLSKGFKKTVGTMATIYASSQLVVQPIIRENINVATASGDFITAQNIAITQALVDKGVGVSFDLMAIAGGFMVGGVVGGAIAGGGVATKYITQAINREQNNRLLNNLNNTNNFINSYEASRLAGVKVGR